MEYFIPAFSALILTAAITPLIRHYAMEKKIVDSPGGRRINTKPIPRLGGVAIVLGVWLTLIGFRIASPYFPPFTERQLFGIFDQNLFGVFLGSLILAITGVVDDIRGLLPWQKLIAQVLAAVCIPLFGIHIQWLAHPFGGPDIQLANWLDNILIVGWIVGVINVVNWLDGLDGLATGIGAIASLILFFLSLAPFVNQPATALLAIILFGACLGFLPYNFNPAKIFLGDSGSMFLGFLLAIIAVISGGKLATAGLVLGIPILDAAWVILRRLFAGQAPWQADRKHLHHRLLDAGLSQRQTVALYWVFAAVTGLVALGSRTYGKTITASILLGLMLILGCSLVLLEKRGRKNGL